MSKNELKNYRLAETLDNMIYKIEELIESNKTHGKLLVDEVEELKQARKHIAEKLIKG